MRRWLGAADWTIERNRPLIRERLVNALLPDNLTCFGMIQGKELADKQYFLERSLLELDMMGRVNTRNQRLAELVTRRSDLQEVLARTQCARYELEDSIQRLKTVFDKNWGDF